MKRFDYLLKAIQVETFKVSDWVYSILAITQEAPDNWKKEAYPYRLIYTPTGYFYVDPENTENLLPIEDATPNEPLFNVKDRILLKAGDLINVKKDIETTVGNVLFNAIVVIYSVKDKIEFITGRVKANQLELVVLERLADVPPEGEERKAEFIYVDEHLKIRDSLLYLCQFTQLCVPGSTEKSLLAPPGIIEFRQKLLDANKDHLDDPAVIARIDAELLKYDAEYLKGDESEGFLISGKSKSTVRRKLFLMTGAETGFDADSTKVDLIPKSLSEGWDVNKFPSMNNTLRFGSYSRGAETMLGGEAVKWLLRASSNINVTEDDCGSKVGMPVFLTEDKKKKYLGFSVVTPTGSEKLTEENIAKYYNKQVMFRSPMFCKLTLTDYCKCCVGDRLAATPTGLSSAVSEYGSVFMLMAMKKNHGTNLELARMSFKDAIL